MVTIQEVTRRDYRSADGEWFGATIRRFREARGLTQAQLAEGASLSSTYLGIIERGENVPTLSVVLQLAAALGLHPMELFRDYLAPRVRR
jgi:transcriptional regulator with XRE-family HTH domain